MKSLSPWAARSTVLFAFWIALSGKFDGFHLTAGAAVALMISFLNRSFDPFGDAKPLRAYARLCLTALLYLGWLFPRILAAAWHVTRLVWSPSLPIRPRFIEHKPLQLNDLQNATLGNSITLTPGTITVTIEDDFLLIHELDAQSSADIRNHNIEKQILRRINL